MTRVYFEEVSKYLYGQSIKSDDQFEDFLSNVQQKHSSYKLRFYHPTAPKTVLSQVYTKVCNLHFRTT